MKKILFVIAFAMFCVGCSERRAQSVEAHYSTDGVGYVVAENIAIPPHLTLTNTVYEITQTNATVTFSFGIKENN